MTIKIQQQIGFLRFSGYVGVSINGIAVPILIYQLTNSAAFAGLSMLVEWIPKLFLYITGGRLAARWKPNIAHIALECSRVVALILLLMSSTGILNIYAISIAAAVYQCANAISNILFENLVTKWWCTDTRMAGHSLLYKRDIESGLIALCLGLLLKDPTLLLIMGTIIQIIVTIFVLKWSKNLHEATKHTQDSLVFLLKGVYKDLKHLSGTGLIPLALLGLSLGIPGALFYSALPFFLSEASSSWSMPEIIFMFGLTRTILNIGWLNILQRTLKEKTQKNETLVWLSFIWFFIGCICILISTPVLLIAGAVWLAISSSLYSPWSRTTRQELLPSDINVRLSLTGVLIATEALSYLAAALLLIVFGNNVMLALAISFGIAIVTILLAVKYKILPKMVFGNI